MDTLYQQALTTFTQLLDEARASGHTEPEAMSLATVDESGQPSLRTVLLKAFDEHGFVFYTHLTSRKGKQLQANNHAALLFLWRDLREAGIQVRIEGRTQLVDTARADAYFASRPRTSQLGAWASQQSQTLSSRAEFEQRLQHFQNQFADQPVPRPPGWSGFCLIPHYIEFWYGAQFRLHERYCYEKNTDGQWSKRLLYP